jgi:hypothetical protein
MATWREVATRALRSAGPTRREKGEALKRAGAEWRRMKGGGDGGEHRMSMSNPGIDKWLKYLAIGGAVYLGYKALTAPRAAAAVPANLAPANTNAGPSLIPGAPLAGPRYNWTQGQHSQAVPISASQTFDF